MSESMRPKLFGALAFVVSLVGGAVAWAGVNKELYNGAFHAPVTEVFPVWALGVLVPVCTIMNWKSTPFAFMTAATVFALAPIWLANAYQADNEEQLTNGIIWGRWPQSKEDDELLDDGSFGNFEVAYGMMATSIFVLVLGFMKMPNGTHLTCGSFFERIAIVVAVGVFGVLTITGLQLTNDTVEDTDPSYSDVLTAAQYCVCGFIFAIAVLYRNSSGGWLAVNIFVNTYLMCQTSIASAGYQGDSDDANCTGDEETGFCSYADNLISGNGLLAAANASALLGMAAHAFFVRGNFGLRDRDCLRFIGVVGSLLAPILLFAAVAADIDTQDGTINGSAVNKINAIGGLMILSSACSFLGNFFHHDGLGSAFHCVVVGISVFIAQNYSGTLMANWCYLTEDGCDQTDLTTPYGGLFVWMGVIFNVFILPCKLCEIVVGLVKNPFGVVTILAAGLSWIQMIPYTSYCWGDDTNASVGDSAEALNLMCLICVVGCLFVGATSPDSSRPMRSLTIFLLCGTTIYALSVLDYWGNLSTMDENEFGYFELNAEQEDFMVALGCACVTGLFGMVSLARTGDWAEEESSSAADAKATGGDIETPRV